MYLSTKCISRSESLDNIYCLYFRYCHSEGEMLRRLADSLFIDNNSRAERATIEDRLSSSMPENLAQVARGPAEHQSYTNSWLMQRRCREYVAVSTINDNRPRFTRKL